MREIKFRCWDVRNKCWYSFPTWDKADPNGTSTESGMELFTDEYYIWSQYTGLKDVKGREIFENDILEIHNRGLWEVRFEAGSFGIHSLETRTYRHYGMLTYSEADKDGRLDYKIVSNRFENPDLLQPHNDK